MAQARRSNNPLTNLNIDELDELGLNKINYDMDTNLTEGMPISEDCEAMPADRAVTRRDSTGSCPTTMDAASAAVVVPSGLPTSEAQVPLFKFLANDMITDIEVKTETIMGVSTPKKVSFQFDTCEALASLDSSDGGSTVVSGGPSKVKNAQSTGATLHIPSVDIEVEPAKESVVALTEGTIGGLSRASDATLPMNSPRGKTKRLILVNELSQLAAWEEIMTRPQPCKTASLGRRWDMFEHQHARRGRIQVVQEPSTPLWVAREDQSRAYKSLTAVAKVLDVNGNLRELNMILDTGSCATLASDRTWMDMGRPKLLPLPRPVCLQDANGHELKVRGIFVMNTFFGGQAISVDALVIQDLAPAVLLGMDFLHEAKATLDMEVMELRMPAMKPIKLSCGPPGYCTVGSEMSLESHEVAQIWVKAPAGSVENQILNVEERTIRQGVYIARSVGQVKGGRVAIQICNSTDSTVSLDKARLLTTASVVQPCHLKSPQEEESDTGDWNTSSILSNGCPSMGKKSIHEVMEAEIQRVCQVSAKEDEKCSPLWTSLDHLDARQQGLLYDHLQPYESLFLLSNDQYPTAALDAVGRIQGGDDTVVCESPYRSAPWKRVLINEQVKGLKEQGLIVETESPWASPVVLVEKPSSPGQWRLCIDYRSLNEVTDPVRWPLPRMDDTIAQLGDYEWFTTIDLAWGFWALPLDERDQEKSAFITEDGHYQWTRLPMGWQGSPAIFQRAMDLLMAGLKGVSVLVYIDDLIIFSKSFEEHVVHVAEVCKRLFEAGRAVKMSKVHWAKQEVNFLGFRVGKGHVTPREDKVQIVLDLPLPTSITAIQSFVGAAGVYRKFIADFATLADPLYQIMATKDMKQWNAKCDRAFHNLKIALEGMAALELPKGSADQAIQVDGDRRGFGGVFLQRAGAGFPWKPVQFVSGVHRGGDITRSGPERVVIAVARILKKVRHLIIPGHVLHVFTEEPAVEWALNPTMVTGRATKAALTAGTFNLKWGRAPGRFQRFGGLFSYNSPELEARQLSAERRKVESQQRRVVLDSFTECSILDAWVVTFDGGYRRKVNMGGFGWSIWDVKDDVWTLEAAMGVPNKEPTTVNLEEFAGLLGAMKHLRTLSSRAAYVFGDSSLVVGALQQKLKCRSVTMVESLRLVNEQVDALAITPLFFQVSRDFNEAADWLANQAMDRELTLNISGDASVDGQQLVRCHGMSLHERIYAAPIVTSNGTGGQVNVVTRAQSVVRKEHSDSQGRLLPWKRIRHGQLNTPWMKSYIEFFEDGIPVVDEAELGVTHFEMNEGILWLTSTRPDEDWRIVMPPLLRPDILAEFHDGRAGGHLKGQRFVQRVRERFYWPKMSKDVAHYENSCSICQLVKGRLSKFEVPFSTLNEVTNKPFQTLAVDSVVNLPPTRDGFKHMIVFVDYFSRYPIAIPVKDLSQNAYLEAITTHIITQHGCPERLVSDKGGQFIEELAQAVYKHMRTRKQATTAYHPQANGLCERMNGTIVQGLKTLAEDHPRDWDRELPWFLLAYRTTVHSITQCTPFELVYGRRARLPYDVMLRHYHEGG